MGNFKNKMFIGSEWGFNFSGVYCVCTKINNDLSQRRVWYVGSAKCISTRFTDPKHPYRILKEKGLEPFIRAYKTDEYRKLEKRIISLLNPPMNKQHRRIIFKI